MLSRWHVTMKAVVITSAVLLALALLVLAWPVLEGLSTLFLNSRIERLGQTGFPDARLESGNVVHCRMQADDFRFPLPPGAHAHDLRLDSGGFDTVHGSVRLTFDPPGPPSQLACWSWLNSHLPIGGSCEPHPTPDGLLVTFGYFGDK